MFIDKGIIFLTDLQFDVDNVRCKLKFSYRAQRVQVQILQRNAHSISLELSVK